MMINLVEEGFNLKQVEHARRHPPTLEERDSTAAKAADESTPNRHSKQGYAKTDEQQSRQVPAWCSSSIAQDRSVPEHSSTTPALFAGTSDEQASPDISRLAPHLQQE